MLDKIKMGISPLTEQVDGIYQGLDNREKMLVNALAIVFIIALLYFLIGLPLYNYANKAKESYIKRVETYQWMQSKAPRSGIAGNKIKPLKKSLLSLVNETARRYKLAVKSAEPKEKEKSIRIRMDDVLIDSVLKWINYLYTTYGIKVAGLTFEEQAVAGKVRVNLTLQEP